MTGKLPKTNANWMRGQGRTRRKPTPEAERAMAEFEQSFIEMLRGDARVTDTGATDE